MSFSFSWTTSPILYLGFVGMICLAIFVEIWALKYYKISPSYKVAFLETIGWMFLAVIFAAFLYYHTRGVMQGNEVLAKEVLLEFIAGYFIEQILSIDNIFVFCLIFSAFNIPLVYQKRVLLYGILSAIILRLIFISIGNALIQYQFVSVILGVFLIVTGIKMFITVSKSDSFQKNALLEWIIKKLPLTDKLEEDKFFIRKNKKWHATPLFVALLCIEFSDIVFAIDSVPAIFSVTNKPFIVFSSNVFSILGLRSLYTLLADLTGRFYYIKYGISAILAFVGIKLAFHEQMKEILSIPLSLSIIFSILLSSIGISIWRNFCNEDQK